MGFDIVSITSLEADIPSYSLQPFVSVKRLDRAQRCAMRRPPLTTRFTVQYAPSPQGPRHIHSIAGGARALDTFLAIEALSLPSPNTPAKIEPHPPPIKRSSSAQAPTRTNMHPPTHTQGREEPATRPTGIPLRQPRRPHTAFLHIVTVKGDPDRDSIPRSRPYSSLVPPTFP